MGSEGSGITVEEDKFSCLFDQILKKTSLAAHLNQKDANQGSGLIKVDTEFSEIVSDVSNPRIENERYPNAKTDKRFLNTTTIGNSYESSDDQVDEGLKRKRKRESYGRMLSWILKVAKDPCDTELRSLPDTSTWKNYGKDQLWKQVLIAREMMTLKRIIPVNWGKRPMHPSIYEDPERVRSSHRVISTKEPSYKTRSPSESSSSGTCSDLEDEFVTNTDDLPVRVGQYFQAQVLEWTEKTSEIDEKYLGSRVWPLEDGEKRKGIVERERMGKGRQDSCCCHFQGSNECIRFHIAEKRTRLKLELGSAFYYWKFDRMGEQVTRSWTKEEEEKFERVIRSNPLMLRKYFTDEAFVKAFPGKKKEELASYYFNVFLLRRRVYQNRSTPSNIDSDYEESEFGLLSDGSAVLEGK